MAKSEEAQLKRLRELLMCNLNDCVSHFVFNVSEHDLVNNASGIKRFSGTCRKCHNSAKLTAKQIWLLESHFGKVTLNEYKPVIDDLLEDDSEQAHTSDFNSS